ncbi:MAG: oxidoreductase [Flavobacterium sp.]|jgi:photosystem II stability/assembly factor-like uncharacterized protein
MRVKYIFGFCLISLLSCSKKNDFQSYFQKINIKVLHEESLSSRAILIDNNNLWYSGNNGKYGAINLSDGTKVNGFVLKDSIKPEFRSIAHTKDDVFILSVANPALMFKINKKNKDVKLVYEEIHEKVFYDSMQFLDDKFGIAMGDPIENCFNIIITNDGGENWNKIPCEKLPILAEGEAAFAASNTNLILRENSIFIVSGGVKSRVFVSKDKGNSWNVYNTPIIQGGAMTGVFTADFYNDKIGVIAGGDYKNQNDNSVNKAITLDGGKTWKLIAKNEGFGYASCIQFVPGKKGNEMVCVGGTGLHYSYDRGKTWTKLLDDIDLLTIRFVNQKSAIATGKNRIIRLDFE